MNKNQLRERDLERKELTKAQCAKCAKIPITDKARRTSYVITFAADPSSIPATIRLRRLLKLAGRYLAMRCLDVREVDASAPKIPPPSKRTGVNDVESREIEGSSRPITTKRASVGEYPIPLRKTLETTIETKHSPNNRGNAKNVKGESCGTYVKPSFVQQAACQNDSQTPIIRSKTRNFHS